MLAVTALARQAARLPSAAPALARAKHSLPDLPYDYNALEPVISAVGLVAFLEAICI